MKIIVENVNVYCEGSWLDQENRPSNTAIKWEFDYLSA